MFMCPSGQHIDASCAIKNRTQVKCYFFFAQDVVVYVVHSQAVGDKSPCGTVALDLSLWKDSQDAAESTAQGLRWQTDAQNQTHIRQTLSLQLCISGRLQLYIMHCRHQAKKALSMMQIARDFGNNQATW